MGARRFRIRRRTQTASPFTAPNALDAEGSPIDLPDIEDENAVEIQQDNLKATQAIYFSWMLEKTRLPQATDKLVQLFNAGLLPFGRRKKRGDDG